MNVARALICWLCAAMLLSAGCVGTHSRKQSGLTVSPVQEIAAGVLLKDASKPENWVEYGRACILSTNYPGAIEAFRTALKIDSEYLPAYEHLALALCAIRENEAAAQVCREGLKVDPGWAPLWLRYGYCLNDMDDLDSALAAFSKVLSLPCEDSHRASALFGRAAVYTKQGMTKEAVIALIEATELSPPEIVEMLSGADRATVPRRRPPTSRGGGPPGPRKTQGREEERAGIAAVLNY